MFVFKFIFVFNICVNCVFGLYLPSNGAEVKSHDKQLIDDLTIIKHKLQPNDKGVSGLDEFHMTNNENFLTKGSSSIVLNDRSPRFINFKKLIKLEHGHRNSYDHSRHFISDHKYCDNQSSEESVEDNTSAYYEWVKYYKQFKARSRTESTTTPLSKTNTKTIKPTTESLASVMAHDDDDNVNDEIDVRFGEDFNELELIRLIPSVIEHLKSNRLTHNDRNILSQIYGDLWLVIDEESKRDREEQKINPILKLILQLKHLRKRDIDRRELTDDYLRNSVDQITNNDRDIVDEPLRIKLGLTESLAQVSPAQRILRTIAMLINHVPPYKYVAPVDQQRVSHDRKNMKLRKILQKNNAVHPKVIRMRRSSLINNNNNNNIGNDIDLYDSNEVFYRQRASTFDDNPSIIELIKLAEIHRLRRQQQFNRHSISLIDKMFSAGKPSSDNDEYYYDDETETDDNVIENNDDNDEEYEEDDEYDY